MHLTAAMASSVAAASLSSATSFAAARSSQKQTRAQAATFVQPSPKLGFFQSSAFSQLPTQTPVHNVHQVNKGVRATAATAPPKAKVKKESKKDDEGISVNLFKPKEPYTGRTLLNTKIVGDDAPGETWHMVFSHEG